MRMGKAKDSEKDKKAMSKFAREYGRELTELSEAISARKTAEENEKKARRKILKAFKDSGLRAFINDSMRIRINDKKDGYVTVDIPELMKSKRDLYENLVKEFPKTVKGHGESIWVKIAKQEVQDD